jgi:hypothetical protein
MTSTNTSFNPNATHLPLVELVSGLFLQKHIHFVPSPSSSNSSFNVLGVLSIFSVFASTTPNQASFSLYELLTIPFSNDGFRVSIADMPFVIGIGHTNNHLTS